MFPGIIAQNSGSAHGAGATSRNVVQAWFPGPRAAIRAAEAQAQEERGEGRGQRRDREGGKRRVGAEAVEDGGDGDRCHRRAQKAGAPRRPVSVP